MLMAFPTSDLSQNRIAMLSCNWQVSLHSLLQGQDSILYRDERKDDYGVDGEVEVKVGGCVTNFRAKVQIKVTSLVSPNQDGRAGAGRAEPCDLVRISKLISRIAALAIRQPPPL
jgi:hypothetical protein